LPANTPAESAEGDGEEDAGVHGEGDGVSGGAGHALGECPWEGGEAGDVEAGEGVAPAWPGAWPVGAHGGAPEPSAAAGGAVGDVLAVAVGSGAGVGLAVADAHTRMVQPP